MRLHAPAEAIDKDYCWVTLSKTAAEEQGERIAVPHHSLR